MGKKHREKKREYWEEVKVETVRLAEPIEGNVAASRSGVPQPTVTSWVRRKKRCGASGAGVALDSEASRAGAQSKENAAAPGVGQCQAGSGHRKKSGGVFRKGIA